MAANKKNNPIDYCKIVHKFHSDGDIDRINYSDEFKIARYDVLRDKDAFVSFCGHVITWVDQPYITEDEIHFVGCDTKPSSLTQDTANFFVKQWRNVIKNLTPLVRLKLEIDKDYIKVVKKFITTSDVTRSIYDKAGDKKVKNSIGCYALVVDLNARKVFIEKNFKNLTVIEYAKIPLFNIKNIEFLSNEVNEDNFDEKQSSYEWKYQIKNLIDLIVSDDFTIELGDKTPLKLLQCVNNDVYSAIIQHWRNI